MSELAVKTAKAGFFTDIGASLMSRSRPKGQRTSFQPPTEIPSADTAFNALIIMDMASSNESDECIEVIEHSKQHKKTYERDLINVIMLSCERRFKWQSNFDFFVAAIAFLIGYDATFSFLRTFERIGLTIVIPYSVLLLCYGVPVMYLELALGQYCSVDSSLIFKRMAPALSAIGYLSWIVAFCAIFVSQGILVLCMDLIFAALAMLRDNYVSFETCHKFYNTESCLELDAINKCPAKLSRYYNSGCVNFKNLMVKEQVDYIENINRKYRHDESTAQYLSNFVSGINEGWIPSNPPTSVLLWMVLCWLILAVVAHKGIEFVIKMSYVTVASLFILMVMLFCSGVAVGGAWPSLSFFFEVRLEHIFDRTIWMETFVYISICLKLGQGGLITLGSYNEFHSNLFLNLLVVIFSSFLCPIMVAFCLTPLYSAFVARLTDEPVDYEFFMDALVNFQEYEGVSVTASSLMLFQTMCGAFIIFFAIGILFLSLGNQMMRITLLMSSMREHFHIFVDTFHRNTMVSLLCVFGCLLNFLFYTMARFCSFLWLRGQNLTSKKQYGVLFYTFLASVFLPLVCSATGMLEVLTVAYVYGSKKMFTNISAMLFGFSQKSRRRGFWRMVPYFNGYMMYCWRYITPLVILTFMIHWIWKLDESHVNIQIAFFGVLIAYSVIAYVPVDCIIRIGMAIYQKEPYLVLFKPHLLLFGPRKQKDRRLAQTQEERWRI